MNNNNNGALSYSSSSSSSNDSNNNGPKVVRKFIVARTKQQYDSLNFLENVSNRNQREFIKYIKDKVIKEGSLGNPKNINEILKHLGSNKTRLRPLYLDEDLDRFEDCFRADGTVKNAILLKWHFIVGDNSTVGLDIDEEFDDDEIKNTKLKMVLGFGPYVKAKNVANKKLKKLDVRAKLKAIGVNASVYGRGCGYKVKDEETGEILKINVLNSKLLGDVVVNPNTWDFLGVNYFDILQNKEVFLSADEIIYVTRNDVHLTEGSLYYGLSDLEPVIDGSETKRILKQKNLKEIAQALYAGFGWVIFKNPNITQEHMQQFLDTIEAGAWTGTDNEVEIHVEKIANDSPMLLEIINEMNRESLRDLHIPSPLIGYEHVQNYASLQQTLEAWKSSVLKSERRWFKDLVQKQLLNDIMTYCLKQEGYEWEEGEPIVLDSPIDSKMDNTTAIFGGRVPTQQQNNTQVIFSASTNTMDNASAIFETTNPNQQGTTALNNPTNEDVIFGRAEQQNTNDPLGIIPTSYEIPPAKLTMEIEEPNFTPFKERVEAGIMLFDKGAISIRKLCEFTGFPEEVEEAELREEEEKNNMMNMMFNPLGQNNNIETDNNNINDPKNNTGGNNSFTNKGNDKSNNTNQIFGKTNYY